MKKLPKCYGIIPARYNSKRFPGKPLANILGKPMFWHVFNRAKQCKELSEVILATDDDRILKAAEDYNIPAVMTRNDHKSGTDRIIEAAGLINVPDHAVVINIQGDEPALEPGMLTELLSPFTSPEVQVTTLAKVMETKEAGNTDRVKVVIEKSGKALYFSRAAIPFPRDEKSEIFYGHIGLYAFRYDTLKQFGMLESSHLETTEKLEQLRMLENGIPIHVIVTDYKSVGVDRPEDIETVTRILLGAPD
jgi:3-deoxy-manno-octulosonate cytidylyltransferase (CMP-KDO synthetase)